MVKIRNNLNSKYTTKLGNLDYGDFLSLTIPPINFCIILMVLLLLKILKLAALKICLEQQQYVSQM